MVVVAYRSRDLANPANVVEREFARFTIQGTQTFAGDLVQDGRVDGADLLEFARHFGAFRNQPCYFRPADFNDDGQMECRGPRGPRLELRPHRVRAGCRRGGCSNLSPKWRSLAAK